MKSIHWFIPPSIVFVAISLLSTVLSVSIQIEGIDYTDKLSHSFAYFALVTTSLMAFYKNGMLRGPNALYLMLACCCYGVFLEFVQYSLFPNRLFEWLDAAANVSGALIGAGLFALVRRSGRLG